eukprot:14209312-Alexandrium_andersonii.AAC.1
MSHSDDLVEIPLSPLQAVAVLSARRFAVDCVLRDETPSEHADLQDFVDARVFPVVALLTYRQL